MSEATKKCPYCAEMIKPEAVVCRFCGRSLTGEQPPATTVIMQAAPKPRGCFASTLRWVALIIGGLVVLGIVINVVRYSGESAGVFPTRTPMPTATPTLTAAQVEQKAEAIPYRDLARNVETHVGKIVHYQGKIIQAVDDGGENFNLRVSVQSEGEDVNDNVVWLNYTGKRILESDEVDFYATVLGMKQYQAVFGNAISIPELTALQLKVVQ